MNSGTTNLRRLEPDEFPQLLNEIPDPPKQLFLRGTLPQPSTKLLTVVGSRKYSSYGKEVCKKLIDGLRGYDIAIVSGLALGTDGIAHKAAINAGLKTIAVPGSGLNDDVLYPRSHTMLAKEILAKGGALLSEFEPAARAAIYTFPQRNRIMAGMSHATLVIEATSRAGTLITSRLATEYNRDVLTVPGSIFSDNSSGPHMLIKLGATPVTSSSDILTSLGIVESDIDSKIPEDIAPEHMEVLVLLSEPMQRDELINNLSTPINESNVILSVMEIKGLIIERLGMIHKA